MAEVNPLEALAPAWELYKKEIQLARQKMHKARRYHSEFIRGWLTGDAGLESQEARSKWLEQLTNYFGKRPSIEWQGDAAHPICVVNGILMFA